MPNTGLQVKQHSQILVCRWSALVSGGASPRTELLHEIDRIAEERFACSGPIAAADGNGSTWSLPPVFDRYVRAAIHAVINGTSYKLVVGECAGWDTNSEVTPPPYFDPPPTPPLPKRCGAAPGCAGSGPCSQEGTPPSNLGIASIPPTHSVLWGKFSSPAAGSSIQKSYRKRIRYYPNIGEQGRGCLTWT